MHHTREFINVEAAVREFYYLQAVESLAHAEPFRHSHERWVKDFNNYKKSFTEKLSVALLDYTTLVVFGEMRHAADRASYYNPHVPYTQKREHSYENARLYSPVSILEAGVNLFQSAEWESGYGGEKWAVIASTALKKVQRIPGWSVDEVFIDRCVDLTHNGSVYFDKIQADVFLLSDIGRYRKFLDFKRYGAPIDLLENGRMFSIELSNIISRGMNLGIISGLVCKPFDSPFNYVPSTGYDTIPVKGYVPLDWGKECLPNILEYNSYYERSDEYDEEEEGSAYDESWDYDYEYESVDAAR